jgi:hypothetical protein
MMLSGWNLNNKFTAKTLPGQKAPKTRRTQKKQIYRLKAKGKFSHGYTLINTDEKIEAKGEKIYELRVASYELQMTIDH